MTFRLACRAAKRFMSIANYPKFRVDLTLTWNRTNQDELKTYAKWRSKPNLRAPNPDRAVGPRKFHSVSLVDEPNFLRLASLRQIRGGERPFLPAGRGGSYSSSGCWRNDAGDMPKWSLNACEKWLRLLNPTRWATCSIDVSPVRRKKSAARRSRTS